MALTAGSGACTIFDGEDEENTWYVTMTKDDILNVVIASTADCPSYIGTICVEEIEGVYDREEDIDREKALEKVMSDLKKQYEFSVTGILKDKIKSYEDKMVEHVNKLQDNTEHAQDLVVRCEEMKKLGRKCYEKLAQLPGDEWTRGAKNAPKVLVKGVANMAGTFAGSKFGNKIFGQKATNLVVDMTSNLKQEGDGPISKFFSRRFVSVGKKIGEIDIDLTSAFEGIQMNEASEQADEIFVPSPMPTAPLLPPSEDCEQADRIFVPPPIPPSMPLPPPPPPHADEENPSF